jgi:hypothetical protein
MVAITGRRKSTPEQTAILPAVNRTKAIRAFMPCVRRGGPETGLGGVGGAGDDDALAMDGQSLRFRYSHNAPGTNGVKEGANKQVIFPKLTR